MRGEADIVLRPDLLGILPDNRVIAGQRLYSEPFADLTAGAAFVRGVVSGLDRDGVGVLRTLVARPELKQLLLIVAVYAEAGRGTTCCPTYSKFRTPQRTAFNSDCSPAASDPTAGEPALDSVRRWRAWQRRHGQCRQPPGLRTLGFNGRGHVFPAGARHGRRRAKVVR